MIKIYLNYRQWNACAVPWSIRICSDTYIEMDLALQTIWDETWLHASHQARPFSDVRGALHSEHWQCFKSIEINFASISFSSKETSLSLLPVFFNETLYFRRLLYFQLILKRVYVDTFWLSFWLNCNSFHLILYISLIQTKDLRFCLCCLLRLLFVITSLCHLFWQ